MQIPSYRTGLFVLFCLLLACSSFFTACRDETKAESFPEIRLVKADGSLTSDTALPPGGSVTMALEANGGGTNITYFGVTMDDGQHHFVLDSGMNHAVLNYAQLIFKGNSATERWTFTVMNRDRKKSSVSVTISKAFVSEWGAIKTYDPVILGAQSNTSYGGFFSLLNGQTSSFSQASAEPALTDIIYYYGSYEATLSSPLESEAPGFFPGLSDWSVKNETRYDTCLLTPAVFDKAQNDSLLLVTYEPVNGKRKAKFLVPGMVVAFRNQEGKAGLLLVKNVTPGTEGNVECAIKVQK